MIGDGEILLRMAMAAALGGLLGIEREFREQPAGFRTHILLAAGACLFAMISAYGFDDFVGRSSSHAGRVDVTRVASQIVVGISFIGAGTVLTHKGKVKGLTTAASVWVTAAVGTAVGLGFFVGALAGAGVGILSLAALRPFKKKVHEGKDEHGDDFGDDEGGSDDDGGSDEGSDDDG